MASELELVSSMAAAVDSNLAPMSSKPAPGRSPHADAEQFRWRSVVTWMAGPRESIFLISVAEARRVRGCLDPSQWVLFPAFSCRPVQVAAHRKQRLSV